VLEVERLRQANLTASEAETRLELLDTQIVMVKEAATLALRGEAEGMASTGGRRLSGHRCHPGRRRYTDGNGRPVACLTSRRPRARQPRD